MLIDLMATVVIEKHKARWKEMQGVVQMFEGIGAGLKWLWLMVNIWIMQKLITIARDELRLIIETLKGYSVHILVVWLSSVGLTSLDTSKNKYWNKKNCIHLGLDLLLRQQKERVSEVCVLRECWNNKSRMLRWRRKDQ